MKDKLIKIEHYNYLDEIVQIIGFKNLSDYMTIVRYEQMKQNELKICEKINVKLNKFKELFSLNEFDLRKIEYCFKNIDQVIGFVKKLFLYLNVPISFSRKNGKQTVRLIPQNNLYQQYIKMSETGKMREIPQNENIEKSVNIKNINVIKSDLDNNIKNSNQIILKESKQLTDNSDKSYMKNDVIYFSSLLKYFKQPNISTYITNDSIELSLLQEFDYFNNIKIARFVNGIPKKLSIGTNIILTIGNEDCLDCKITKDTKFDGEYFIYNIDFPSVLFFKYQCIKLKIKSKLPQKYMLNIFGSKVNSSFPKSILNNFIEIDHDPKWYSKGEYVWRIANGMTAPDTDYIRSKKRQINLNNLSFEKIQFKDVTLQCLKHDNDETDNIDFRSYAINLLEDTEILNKYNNNCVIINSYETCSPNLRKLDTKSNTVFLKYNLIRCADLIYKIDILRLEGFDFEAYYETSDGNYETSGTIFNFIARIYCPSYLVIKTHIDNISIFENITVKKQYIFCNSNLRLTFTNKSYL